jgi:benzylsuccinate CoA-transferase BbsF subunit
MRNSQELDSNVSQWTAGRSAEEAMELLQRAGIMAGVVSNGADLCARDPQLKARDFWGTVTLPDGAKTHVTGIPIKMSRTPGRIRTPSPPIGSANDYVIGELLGYSAAEREALVAENAIWP